eukprot:2637146-Ditylum_brightwellii.AAC.1
MQLASVYGCNEKVLFVETPQRHEHLNQRENLQFNQVVCLSAHEIAEHTSKVKETALLIGVDGSADNEPMPSEWKMVTGKGKEFIECMGPAFVESYPFQAESHELLSAS